ncbi:hypothetical protein G6F24_013636 [Rhizopus arrhizus]|nr:hypothetical protein G6F24_013636 [Rhizopus arrhizus]
MFKPLAHAEGAAQPPAEVVALHAAATQAILIPEAVPAQPGQHVPARAQGQFILQIAAVALAARGGAAPGQGGQVVVMLGAGAIDRVEQIDAAHRAGAACQVGAVGGLCSEVGVELVHIGAEQHLVLDAPGVDPPDCIRAGGERLVVTDLVAQLARHPLGHAIAVTVDQPHRLVVHLVLVVAEPACGNVHIKSVARRETVLHQCHLGAHVEEVAGLVVVPAAVGQEGPGIVYRYTAQPVAAQVLGDVGELQHQFAGLADIEGQRRIADHAFAVGVPAHALGPVPSIEPARKSLAPTCSSIRRSARAFGLRVT